MSRCALSNVRTPMAMRWVCFGALLILSCAAQSDPLSSLQSRLNDIFEKHQFDISRRLGPMQWLAQGESYAMFEPSANGRGFDLVRYEAASGKREVLVSASQLTAPGATSPLVIDQYAVSPDPAFAVSMDAKKIVFPANFRVDSNGIDVADFWLFDRKAGVLTQVAVEAEQFDGKSIFSSDGARIAYVRAHNLYVRDLQSGQVTQLTADGVISGIGNGASDWGGAGMVRWSPDGQRIAYVQEDSRDVGLFPITNNTEATYPKARYLRFSQVGSPIAKLRVGIVSASGGTTQWVDLGEEGRGIYISELEWTSNPDELVIHKLSRSRDTVDVLLANARTGAVSKLYHEQNPSWVRDTRFANESGLEWIQNGKAFTWLSERNGWRQAFTVSRDGKQQTPLTPDNVDVISPVKVDKQHGWFYYIASPDNATQRYLYRAHLDGSGQPQRITPSNQPGMHNYQVSSDARYALHSWSRADSPPITDLIELPQHRVIRVLDDNAALREKMKAWNPRPTEFFKIDIGGGVVMDAWMLKPRDFDPSKKYPVLIFVYGEPASQTVIDSWSQNGQGHSLFHRAIADAGYLVVSMDNRGTPAPKGSAWRRAVFGSLGPLSTEEQAAGLRELGRMRPYVDLSRVGIWGWSAGGTNTLNALFQKPDQYHVGIAVVPKPRPDLYNAWYQEIFMRTPEENPEGYRRAAAINYAEGFKGNLLIVTGTGETNTHIQIVEHLVNRLIELRKPFDYMVYPNRNHNMRQGEETRPHLFNLIARYLTEHLPAGGVSHENIEGDRVSSRPSSP